MGIVNYLFLSHVLDVAGPERQILDGQEATLKRKWKRWPIYYGKLPFKRSVYSRNPKRNLVFFSFEKEDDLRMGQYCQGAFKIRGKKRQISLF